MNGEGSIFRRTSDGRWIAQVTEGPRGGRRVTRRVGRTRAEAKLLLEELRGGRIDPKTTVGVYLRSWLQGQGRDVLKASTWTTYELAIRLHIIPTIGHISLGRLRAEHIDGMLAELTGMAPKGRRNVLNILSRILRVAELRGLVVRNPAAVVERPRVSRAVRPSIGPADASRILAAVKGERLEALYVLALFSGLRMAELLGLRWEDVDFDAAELRVTYVLARSAGRYVLDEPKTVTSRRVVSIDPDTLALLREHRSRQLAERLAAGVATEDGLVFLSPAGRPISGGWLTHHWRDLADKAGIKLRFHDLRHAHISLGAAAGVNPRVMADRVGHATTAMTLDRYTHPGRGSDEDAAKRIRDSVSAGVSAGKR